MLPHGAQVHLAQGLDDTTLVDLMKQCQPDWVINCVGVIKQVTGGQDPRTCIDINAHLPHRLSDLCRQWGARLLHFSTDCVFSGARGHYQETDFADADDVYGRTKFLGELDAPHTVTLRTSIIGHELGGKAIGLLGWLLAQKEQVSGFRRAIFSGLPTTVLAQAIADHILQNPRLSGLFHVSAPPIDKYSLLQIINDSYGLELDIVPQDIPVIDRSLNGSKFEQATGFRAEPWPALVQQMHKSSHFWGNDFKKIHLQKAP
jgi:dTDP-4-dehydrorhamnose reductase